MKLKPVVRGLISYVPGLLQYLKKKRGNRICGGTDSARYCYSIWMRHMIYLNENFGEIQLKNVAEIGPGDSLGMGLMALITGSEKYFVFEVEKLIDTEKNSDIFNELVNLFLKKEAIPGDEEFPFIQPKLKDYKFPEDLFEGTYEKLTDAGRLEKIRNAIINGNCEEMEIKYIIPWTENYKTLNENIDLLFTQAVMEHIVDLENAYKIMYIVLRNGGMISHEIDYSSHETHESWDGHLNYGNFLWKIIMHGRPYEINRLPHSMHIEYLKQLGFTRITESFTIADSSPFKTGNRKIYGIFTDKDRRIQNAFIQASKP